MITKKNHNRVPKLLKEGCGYDILSSDRQIEVKGRSSGKKSGVFVYLNENNIKSLQKQSNWYLYVVYDLKDKEIPKLRIFTKAAVLGRVKFTNDWEVDLRKDDFNSPDQVFEFAGSMHSE